MPVLGFTGLPGHGKSYGVVSNVILPALIAGRTVVTNIPLHRENLRTRLTAEGASSPLKLLTIDVSKFADGSLTFADNVPDGAIVVLDEVWRLWPSGLKTNNVPEDHKSFLAEHRHRVGTDGKTMEIVLVTQDLMQIAAFARQLVERTYVVHKLKEVGATNRYTVTIYSGVRAGDRGGHEIGKSRGKYEESVFKLYKSHTKSDAIGIEAEADERGTVWSSGLIVVGLPIAILVGAFGVWNLLDIFQGYQGGDAQAAEQSQETDSRFFADEVKPPAPGNARRTVAATEATIPDSDSWRIAGTIENELEGFAFLQSQDGGYRYVPLSDCEQISEIQVQYACIVDGRRVTSWTGNTRSRGLQLN